MFSRHVDAVVVALHWSRTVVIEQGRWKSCRTRWKPPHGANIRNLREVHVVEPEARATSRHGPTSEVIADHTYFEYEEFGWHKYRSFSARGEGTADVCWPEYTLQADQRTSEQRETYHARFSIGGDDGADDYMADLDEASWLALEVGLRCRLKVGALSREVEQVTPVLD